MRQRQEYIPLSTGSPSHPDRDGDIGLYGPRKDDSHGRLMLWATIGVVLTTLLSSTLLVLGPDRSSREASVVTHDQPNPYIHLEKLLVNSTLNFEPVVNFPEVTLQYLNGDVKRRMYEDGRDYPTSFGMIYPDDRRIIADNEISTVVQFRNLDYAMERCVLHIEIPRATGKFDPDVKLSDPSHVDVWLLDARTELSRYITGSTDYAPPRRDLMATLAISNTSASISETFICRTGEYTTIELTCAPNFVGCAVHFWQDRRVKPRAGVFLMQHPSLNIGEGDDKH